MPRLHQWVPDLLARCAHGYLKYRIQEIEYENAPHEYMDDNEESQIAFAVRDENSQVLE